MNDQAKLLTYTRRGEGGKEGKKARKKRKKRWFYLKVMYPEISFLDQVFDLGETKREIEKDLFCLNFK